jgi:glycosyltransferase involved in cell wall biosynthesis
VDEELPYPPISGKRIRTLNLTLRLAERHRISYLAYRNRDSEEADKARAYFEDHGIQTVLVDRSFPPKSGPGFYARLAANLLSPLPYLVSSQYTQAMRRAIQEFAALNDLDLWHCEWTPYAALFRGLGQPAPLVMAHNVESLIWQRYHETETNPIKRWYIKKQWHKMEHFERQAFAEARRTVAVSPEDARLIDRRFGSRHVDVVDNGVDTSYFQPTGKTPVPGQILFLGSLDWRPNLDGVSLLLESIFPAVLSQVPSAQLCLVGRNPPAWLNRKAAQCPQVKLHATVEDVRPYLAQSSVMAVPLRVGGGSRLKILEALASGVSVVSTRVGAEGLQLEAGRHLTVVEDVAQMADAIVHSIRAPEAARALAQAGRRCVLERYDWDVLADKLERVWMNCVCGETVIA